MWRIADQSEVKPVGPLWGLPVCQRHQGFARRGLATLEHILDRLFGTGWRRGIMQSATRRGNLFRLRRVYASQASVKSPFAGGRVLSREAVAAGSRG